MIDDKNLTVARVNFLKARINSFETMVEYLYNVKYRLYLNLGICYANLGDQYNKEAVEAFKKYFFYLLKDGNTTAYSLTCFAFHGFSKHFLKNLSKEKLNLSSPLKFNDIFDCPILDLLNNDNGPSRLKRDALLQCVKLACFTKNEFLPTVQDILNGVPQKTKSDAEEYRNELLWSHYADNHQGLCVEYVFNSSITKSDDKSSQMVWFFREVQYLSDLDKIKHNGSINIYDGFFVKSKAWSYENELRLLHFDLNGNKKDRFSSISISQSVKSVTFGERCSELNIKTTIYLLKNKKYKVIDEKGSPISKEIEFYQMKKDEKVFGRLNRERLDINNFLLKKDEHLTFLKKLCGKFKRQMQRWRIL